MKYRICLPSNGFFSTCVYLWGNLRVRLATQRKSLRKFNLRPLATTCESVWPELKVISLLFSLLERLSFVEPPCFQIRSFLEILCHIPMPKPANPRRRLKTTQSWNVKALVSPPKKTITRDGNRALSLPKVSATRPRTKAPSKVQRYRTKPRASSFLNGAADYRNKSDGVSF